MIKSTCAGVTSRGLASFPLTAPGQSQHRSKQGDLQWPCQAHINPTVKLPRYLGTHPLPDAACLGCVFRSGH